MSAARQVLRASGTSRVRYPCWDMGSPRQAKSVDDMYSMEICVALPDTS